MSAITQEIPPRSWPAYFREIIDIYRGWAASVEVLSQDLGDQPMVSGRQLQGFTCEIEGSETGDILIELGDDQDFLIHHVDHPRTVRVAQTEPGVETTLQFESDDGTITLVILRSRPALPPAEEVPFRIPHHRKWQY